MIKHIIAEILVQVNTHCNLMKIKEDVLMNVNQINILKLIIHNISAQKNVYMELIQAIQDFAMKIVLTVKQK